jgi:hypothetical protein
VAPFQRQTLLPCTALRCETRYRVCGGRLGSWLKRF